MNIFRLISTAIDNGRRIIKTSGYGRNTTDTRTSSECSPAGMDSCPVSPAYAIYAQTDKDASPVILGYLPTSQVASAGEVRIFSVDTTGAMLFEMYLKSDGTLRMNGDADNLVRYSALEAAFNELKNDFNALVATFNTHTHPYVNVASPAVTSPTTSSGNTSAADITPAKITEITTT
jgi:hypothetical protein